MSQNTFLAFCAAFVLSVPQSLPAQALTGQVAGQILDQSGRALPDVAVTLTDPSRALKRATVTSATGAFVFAEILPATYDLLVELHGFKNYEQQGIALALGERLVLNPIKLQVGQIHETVVVTETAPGLDTQSSDRSGLVDSRQLQELSLKGRDYLGTLQLLPGVLDTAYPTREAPGNRALIGLYIDGNRQGTLNLALDGISTLSLGGGTGPFLEASDDAVAQVQVLLTNYPAEYGRSVGGTINTVTKSGTRDYHGGAYYYLRNTDFNANDFFANRQDLPRAVYRYNNPGYFLGGPVGIPGTKLKTNNKLFFFWSQEFLIRTVPSAVSFQTFPTALEREGNFSASTNQGTPITIRDPSNGSPFPGNIVPTNRISPQGQALLNLFPLPNTVDPSGADAYNAAFQSPIDEPHRDAILRVDWNISSGTTFYVRGIDDYQATQGAFGFVLASPNWPQLPVNYTIPCRGIATTLIHSFSPTQVNEMTFGVNRGLQNEVPLTQAGLTANQRTTLGVNIPQFYPGGNPYDLVPNATFAGISNAPALDIDPRFPYYGRNNVWVYMDNYSQTVGRHNLKFGVYVEQSAVNEANGEPFNGTFGFDLDPVNNPLDTGYAFSNAIVGSVNSYTEATAHPGGHTRDFRVEWYGQDHLRVTSRLTVDFGMRFNFLKPTFNEGDPVAVFDPSLYQAGSQPPLIQPYVDPVSGARVGRDPATGAEVAAVKIGTFSSAAGTANQGMKVYEPGQNIMKQPPIQLGPRAGFAWDIFGNGMTAIRSGYGMYYDRFPDDEIAQLAASPPLVNIPTAYYTTINNLLSSPLSLSPNTVWGIDRNWKPLAVYNWSFGVQQKIGFGAILDVAYVGNVSRHGMQVRDLNATAYGTDFLPSSADPTRPGSPLPANFLRPYPGYADIQYIEFGSNSNYNALQVQLNKRLSSRLTFSAAYSWSKVLDVADTPTSYVNPVINFNSRDYGPAAFDRRQNVSLSWVYSLPAPAKSWSAFSRQILGGWEVSGIASFISGAPTAITYSLVTPVDLTGANGLGVDSRVDLTCNPNLGWGKTSFNRAFNTSCIEAPTKAELGIGNASKYPFVGPGVENFDISLVKSIRLGQSENRRLQFRAETYNTLNHPQFTTVNANALFSASGAQVNAALGQYTADQPPRRLVLSLKLYF